MLLIGDIATGEFVTSSVAQVRPSITEKRSLSVEEDSVETSIPAPASVTTEIVSPSPRPTRPFVRKVRAKVADNSIPELIKEIVQSQEKFNSRMSKYDKVIQIFQERFRSGLNAVQEMGFIALFADHPSFVDQFFSFNEEQRAIFVADKMTRFR